MARHRRIAVLVVALAASLAVACGVPAGEGGETPTPSGQTPTPTPASYYGGDILLELVAPTEVRQGEAFGPLDVRITNNGDGPFTLYYSGDLLDFEVLDADGNLLWKHLHAYVQPLIIDSIDPGESLLASSFDHARQGSWDLRDDDSFPVAPGTYFVRGVLRFSLEDPGPNTQYERLDTAQHPFTVHEAPLPDYAQAVELELLAPTEARAGETVPMDLRITNHGDEPLVLWWSGGSVAPPPNLLDVVVFDGREVIWRASLAHHVSHQGHVVLAAGETRTMSSLFEPTGAAWTWDQRADCGQFRFEPCPEPVAPGTYTLWAVANVSPMSVLEPDAPFERTPIATDPVTLTIRP